MTYVKHLALMVPFNNTKSQLGTRRYEQKAETLQGTGQKGKASAKSQQTSLQPTWIPAKRHTQ